MSAVLSLYCGYMSKFVPCRICAKKEGPQSGFYYVVVDGVQYVKECSCHKQWLEKQTLSRKLSEGNIWNSNYSLASYAGERSRDNIPLLEKYVALFEERFADKVVYFYGGNGTQKTTLAMWLAKSLVLKGHSVYYTLMESLTSALLPDYNNQNPSRGIVVQKALEADLLIIDESFDKSKLSVFKSGYHIPFIDRFIRERIDVNKKATLFISNVLPSNIATQGFGDSLQNLIVRNVKQSTLAFEDVYIDTCNVIDSKGIFR